MREYKLLKSFTTGEICSVTIVGKNITIPFDEANTCYQAYLKWLSEGNEPLPPDETAVENEQPSA